MLYSHLRLWISNGQVWHSFYRPGTCDMTMGVTPKPEKTIEWAKMHKMTIIDEREITA